VTLRLVAEGGNLIEPAEAPEKVDFKCWHCKRPAVMYPRAQPIAVMHQIPACDEWKRIEKKEDDLARYLIKCGVHVHVPGSELPGGRDGAH